MDSCSVLIHSLRLASGNACRGLEMIDVKISLTGSSASAPGDLDEPHSKRHS
jgi:hypothetical protein